MKFEWGVYGKPFFSKISLFFGLILNCDSVGYVSDFTNCLNHVFFLRSSYLLISTIIFSNYLQMTHFKNHAEPERNGSLLNLLMKSTPQVSNYLYAMYTGILARKLDFHSVISEINVKSNFHVCQH